MAVFHRLTVPSYNGGLPSGYDYINNATSGTPAPADGQRAGGPNVGTYFVGFTDDGTSINANRPAAALAQNTDYLDNLLHQDLAIPLISSVVTSVGDSSFLAVGHIYVGVAGTPNTSAGIATFVKILDTNGDEIIGTPSTGAVCQVVSISGATVGTGFSSGNVTFTITPAIPSGVQYRVFYAIRGNLATLPADALTNINIRSVQEIPAGFEDFEKMVSRFSGLNVAAIVGTIFETPDGIRLAKHSTQTFDVDPDGTSSDPNIIWLWRAHRDTGSPISFFKVSNEALVTPATGGVVARMRAGVVDYHIGTFSFSDVNTRSSSANGVVPFSSSVRLCSRALLINEGAPSPTDIATYSLDYNLINAVNTNKLVITCGDGTNSFGDFNGSDAIYKALQYAIAQGGTVTRIFVKSGGYSITNSTRIVVPIGHDITIEGVSPRTVQITGTSSSPPFAYAGSSAGNGRLTLRNLFFQWGLNSTTLVDFSFMTLFMEDCVTDVYTIFAIEPQSVASASTSTRRNCLTLARCAFYSSSAPALPALITLQVNTDNGTASADVISGVFIHDCYLATGTNTALLRIQGNSTLSAGSLSLISNVVFERCQIQLGQTTNGSGAPAAPAGVLDFFPNNGGNGSPFLRDITFRDCHVIAASGSGGTTSNILMRTLPAGRGVTSSPGDVCILGQIVIDGGTWEIDPTDATLYSPFLLIAQNISIKNVQFLASSVGHGIPGTDAAYAATQGAWTMLNADWAGFVISASGAGTNDSFAIVPPGLKVENCGFMNLPRASTAGDLWLNLTSVNNEVDGIVLNYVGGGSGSLPNSRVRVRAVPLVGSKGLIKGIHLNGMFDGSAAHWISGAGGHNGFILCVPNTGLHLKSCVVRNFLEGVSTVGQNFGIFSAANGSNYHTNDTCSGLVLEDCSSLYGQYAVSFTPSAAHSAADVRIVGGHFDQAIDAGILISPFNTAGSYFSLSRVQVTNTSAGPGLKVVGVWSGNVAPRDRVSVVNSMFSGNTTNEVYFNPTTSAPFGVFIGNCIGSTRRLFYNENSAQVGPSFMRGMETTLHVSVPSTPSSLFFHASDFSSEGAQPMIHNDGLFEYV